MGQPQPDGGLVGRTLGPYQVLESLGSGGMGHVYLALDTRLDRRVALKVLPPEMASHPEKIKRFEREARTVASLSHPGIVTLYSPLEEQDGLRFLTMELVEGETLSKSIPARGFSMERFLSLAIAVTDAVSAAHRQGILHRDLKPENVMLTPDGRLKVLDFGLAKLRYDADEGDRTTKETQSVTQDGRIVGTVAYMSPEQAQGLPVDHRSDIFALGILLYEMATGERPFRGNTNLSVLSSILKDTPRPASELRDEIPKPLARMIQRALEKRPEDRYQSASDLRRDLEDLKRDVDSGELVLGTTAGRQRVAAPPRAEAALGAARRDRHRAPGPGGDGRGLLPGPAARDRGGRPALGGRLLLRQPHRRPAGSTGCGPASPTCWSRTSRSRRACACWAPAASTSCSTRPATATTARSRRQVVDAVSRKAQATTALVGSFVRAGSQVRIQATLQDPKSGEVLASERVEGDAEDGLFALVDELTGRLRKRLETPLADEDGREAARLLGVEGEEAPGGHDHLGRGVEGLRRGQPPPRAAPGEGGAGLLREGGRGRPELRDGPRQALDRPRQPRQPREGARLLGEGGGEGGEPAAGRALLHRGAPLLARPVDDGPVDRRLPEGRGRGPRPHRGPQQPRPAAARPAALPRGPRAPRGAAPARHDVPRQLHEPGPGLRVDRPAGRGARGPRRVRGRAPGPGGELREPRLTSSSPRGGPTPPSPPSTRRRRSSPTTC